MEKADFSAAVQLNKAIGAAASVTDLLALTHRAQRTMNLVNCVTSLQRLAKLACDMPVEVDSVAHITERATLCFASKEPGVQPRHISGTLWACAKLNIAPRELIQAVFHRSRTLQGSWFKPVELSMAVWAIGKLRSKVDADGHELVARLLASALDRPATLDTQALSNIAIGLSHLSPTAQPERIGRLLGAIRDRLAEFSPQEVANTLSAFARLGARLETSGGLAESMARAVKAALAHFSPQQLANTLWAVVKLLETASPSTREALDLSELLSRQVEQRAHELNAHELSMCCWALSQSLELSSSTAEHARLTEALCGAARRLAAEMEPQQLATVALALVKLGISHSHTLKRLAAASRQRMGEFNAQDLDNLASAYARLSSWRAPKLVGSIASAATASLSRLDHPTTSHAGSAVAFAPRNVANVLWAIAKLSSACEGVRRPAALLTHRCTLLAARATLDVRAQSELPRWPWITACAQRKQRRHALEIAALADAAAATLSSRMAELNARDLSNAAWAFATLGKVSGKRLECMLEIGERAAHLLASFNAQECSKLLFAFGKARLHSEALEQASSSERVLRFEFVTGPVSVRAIPGGARFNGATERQSFRRRECTNATIGTGRALWEDAFVMAEWLSRQPSPQSVESPLAKATLATLSSWRDVHMVELGAGVGLCSIVAHQLGMCVTATDGYGEVLHYLSQNIAPYCSTEQLFLRAKLLHWGTPKPLEQLGFDRPPDLVLATGCVYGSDNQVFEALIHTIDALAGPASASHLVGCSFCGSTSLLNKAWPHLVGQKTLVLMCHGNGAAPGVHQLGGPFYELASKHFEIARVAQHELHSDHQGCQIHCMRRRCQSGSNGKKKQASALTAAATVETKRRKVN